MESEETVQPELTREEKHLRSLDRMCLMDDPVFSEALNGKLAAVQDILSTILERDDFTVVSTETQAVHSSAVRRSVRFDIEAHTDSGQVMDIEVQRVPGPSDAQRARFYSSMIDKNLLEKGDDFGRLPETWVIFIMESDPYKAAVPMYHIDRTIDELSGTKFRDGAHIIYVNGTFRDLSHPVGRLMHDFHCTKADDMLNPLLAGELRKLKETEGGRRHMSGIMQQLCEEAANEARYNNSIEIARELSAQGIAPEQVAKATKLPLNTVLELAGAKSA